MLSAWRFLFGAGLTWGCRCSSPAGGAASAGSTRRPIAGRDRARRHVRRQLRHVLRRARDGVAVAGGADRLHLSGPRGGAVAPVRPTGWRAGAPWIALGIWRSSASSSPLGGIDPDDERRRSSGLAAGQSRRAVIYCGLDRAGGPALRRAPRVGRPTEAGRRRLGARPPTALMMTATAAVFWMAALAGADRSIPRTSRRRPGPTSWPSGSWRRSSRSRRSTPGRGGSGPPRPALISTVEPIWTIVLAAILFSVALDADPARGRRVDPGQRRHRPDRARPRARRNRPCRSMPSASADEWTSAASARPGRPVPRRR